MNSAKVLDHLLSTPSENWILTYLPYLIGAIFLGVIFLAIFLRLRKRKEVYKKFDSRWFWGYLGLSLMGGFIWFSIDQILPTFGTYLALYLWLGSLIGYSVYLAIYYRRFLSRDIAKYHEKKRKEKYLK